VVGLILFLFAEPLVAMFSTTPEVISVGSKCLRIAAIAQPLMAITDVYGGALRGAGDTISPMLSAIVGPLLIRLTLCWYLAFHLDWGLVGIWIGSTADWAVRALWLWAVFRRGRWMRLRI
jgi:Na+-driven multidrug efflux pump